MKKLKKFFSDPKNASHCKSNYAVLTRLTGETEETIRSFKQTPLFKNVSKTYRMTVNSI